MLERERHSLILKLVEERSIVSVGDLLDLLGASEATIRRDINALGRARRGEAHPRRRRSGASATSAASGRHAVRDEPGRQRAAEARDRARRRRAHRAGREHHHQRRHHDVRAGGVPRRLTISTSSPIRFRSRPSCSRPAAIASRCRAARSSASRTSCSSPFENDTIESFWGNKLFIGCYGLNRFGMMEADPLIVQAQTKLLKRTEHVIVMADSSKLRRKSAMIVAGLERINTIVTDDGAQARRAGRVQGGGHQSDRRDGQPKKTRCRNSPERSRREATVIRDRIICIDTCIGACRCWRTLARLRQERSRTPQGRPRKTRIGIVAKSLGNGFFDAVHKGADEAGEELDAEIIFTGPTTPTAEGQIETLNALIAQRVDAIAISANDPDALVPTLQARDAARHQGDFLRLRGRAGRTHRASRALVGCVDRRDRRRS